MQNKTITASQPQTKEALTVAFQNFNGVFLAKISNLKDKETFAYGETKAKAQMNAIQNYSLKYAVRQCAINN